MTNSYVIMKKLLFDELQAQKSVIRCVKKNSSLVTIENCKVDMLTHAAVKQGISEWSAHPANEDQVTAAEKQHNSG